MKKYVTVISSFIIMVCLGGIYSWSIIASELIEISGFSATQTQIVFGTLVAIFPITMIFVGKFANKLKKRILTFFSAIPFILGYIIAGFSDGNFLLVLLGIGIFVGISTGFGYWVSLTIPVKWFPEKKGLITGIAAAGFGIGALVLSNIIEIVFKLDKNIFDFFLIIGAVYGTVIFIFSNLIYQPTADISDKILNKIDFLSSKIFKKLFLGLFLGTFAGLLIIGSLKLIGGQNNISTNVLILGVSFFAISNFVGRIFWGYLSDYIGASLTIFFALTTQSLAILFLGTMILNNDIYLLLSMIIGFGFGGNFVLFAKETAQIYGVNNLGSVYPFVFLGYAFAGIAGPISGGVLFDFFGSFTYPVLLASILSLSGGLLFLLNHYKTDKND